MLVLEKIDFFPKLLQKQINQLVTDPNFEWYYRKKIDSTKSVFYNLIQNDFSIINGHGFRHILYDHAKDLEKQKNIDLIETFKIHLEKNFNCKVNKILRAMVMFTLPDAAATDSHYFIPHVDYFLEHKTLLYYANDSDGDTFIFNEQVPLVSEFNNLEKVIEFDPNYKNRTIMKKIKPEQGKAVLFNGLHYHAAGVPTLNNRYIININFQ